MISVSSKPKLLGVGGIDVVVELVVELLLVVALEEVVDELLVVALEDVTEELLVPELVTTEDELEDDKTLFELFFFVEVHEVIKSRPIVKNKPTLFICSLYKIVHKRKSRQYDDF